MKKADWKERRTVYVEKLRDPRWQRKRLEIMQRDDFTCQNCFDNHSTLNVHHNYYNVGAEPWDYPSEALVTLCETCHQEESERRREEEQALLRTLRRCGFKSSHINGLYCALMEQFGDQPMFGDYDEFNITEVICHYGKVQRILGDLTAKTTSQESIDLAHSVLTVARIREIVKAINDSNFEDFERLSQDFLSTKPKA